MLENRTLINELLLKYNISLPIKDIENRYNEPHRYYHTTKHINFIIEEILKIKLPEKDTDILIISALFHDIIFTPGDKSNEQQSADFLLKYVEETPEINQVYDIIIDTSTHIPRTKLSEIFCDIDMMSLTDKSFEEMLKDTVNVHKEFIQFFDKDKVIDGQLKFYKSLLDTKYGKKNEENLLRLIKYFSKDMKFLESFRYFNLKN